MVYILRARTKEGHDVTLALLPKHQIEKLRKETEFYCPECHASVVVRAGAKVIPHFAHRSTLHCSIQGGEGVYHQKGKLLLYEWLKNQHITTELEKYIPSIKQRPDLFIQIGQRQIAIEFQCATISQAEIRNRTIGYQRAKIIPIWILGANHFKRTSHHQLKINHFMRSFIQQFSSDLPTTLFYFCPLTKQFSIVNDLYMTSPNRALATFHFKHMNRLSFVQLFSKRYLSRKMLYTLWKNEKRKFRLRQNSQYGKELKWHYWLYEKGLHRDKLPSIIYLPIQSQYKMNVSLWNWQSRFIIDFFHPLSIGESFHQSKVMRFLRPFMCDNEAAYQPIEQYMYYLEQLNMIENISDEIYVKRKSVHFYNRIDQAINGDDELLNRFMYNQRQE